ncbi:MAG: hypothetical protein Q8P25_04000 [Candidatus Curtissbacteria bacterium]|nr:hypothetical protein [Candidatus Curtissbacteria bacterium]
MRWSTNLAYAVGLITTDGCLSIDGRHIDLTSKDKDQIKTFAKLLNLKNKIGLKYSGSQKEKIYCRIQFGNVKFYRFLIKIGLSPHKSKTLGILLIPNKFFRDFLRGHLDGDGCIISYEDRYNTPINPKYVYQRLMTYFMSASKPHMEWLQMRIKNSLDIQGALLKRKPNEERYATTWTLKFSKKESIILLNWLYYSPSVPYLKRKYRKAKPYLASTTSGT